MEELAGAYKVIEAHYGTKVAARSGVPLMNHIDEGLILLEELGASVPTKSAWCLHPIIQDDHDFINNVKVLSYGSRATTINVLEYRRAANAYLCKPYTDSWGQPTITEAVGYISEDVRKMLIADKEQNFKDFMGYHYGTHERGAQLLSYFGSWLKFLGVEVSGGDQNDKS